MTTVEERIQQEAEKNREYIRSANWDNTLAIRSVSRLEYKVLQILAEGFFIPYDISDTEAFETVLRSAASHKNLMVIKKEKWRELLKLLQKRPKTHGSMPYLPLGGEWETFHCSQDKWYKKIEEKLKEIQKCGHVKK